MNREEISAVLMQFIQSSIIAGHRPLDEQMDLRVAGVDSFSIVEIILFIESHFAIVVPDEKLLPQNFSTLFALSEMVYNLKKG